MAKSPGISPGGEGGQIPGGGGGEIPATPESFNRKLDKYVFITAQVATYSYLEPVPITETVKYQSEKQIESKERNKIYIQSHIFKYE